MTMNSSSGKVDFLLEIMKVKTATRQQQSQPQEEPMQPFCSDCGVSDYDVEVRDGPPKASPSQHVYAFDYYGNLISEQDHKLQQKSQERVHNTPAAAATAATATAAHIGNGKSPNAQGDLLKEDYSEFLEEAPGEGQSIRRQHQYHDVEVEDGCVAEFGQCVRATLCCIGDHELVDDAANNHPSPLTREQIVHKEISDELDALRKSTIEAKTAKAVLEFDLRTELAEARRQKSEMEDSYRREIAREVTEKALLQARLQTKLLSMMEERIMLEMQLDRLDATPSESVQQGPPTKSMLSQTTQDGSPTKSTDIVPLVATNKGQQGLLTKPSLPPEATDPPSHTPVDPLAGASSNILTCTPKTSLTPVQMKKVTPYGLSIVVENSHDGGDRIGSLGSINSPTAHRSFSPTPRIPPASGRSCEPDGITFEKVDSLTPPSSNRSREPPSKSQLLATSDKVIRRFEAPE